ncbi:hypothetical protein G6F56_004214 [Rhizopus delemar]|nr:hypothetical protein G6F56_004214 [Rhizopus delemar]
MNSAARDADLRRRLLQRQNQIANEQKTPETPASPRPTASKQSNPVELQRKKRKFQKLRNTASSDTIIQNAKKLNLEIWPFESALNLMNVLMESSAANAKAHETAQRDEKKSNFVEFTGYYLMVEDATQVHCPVMIKEYSKEINAKPQLIPWPTMRRKRRARPQDNQPQDNQPQDNQPQDNQPHENQPQQQPLEGEHELEAENQTGENTVFKKRKIQEQESNTTDMNEKLPNKPDENGDKADVVDNKPNVTTKTIADKIDTNKVQADEDKAEAKKLRQEQENNIAKRKRNVDFQYCENCNEKFTSLTEHVKTPNHTAFLKSVDNFLELERLLKSVKRP